jgi:hypothetical protein
MDYIMRKFRAFYGTPGYCFSRLFRVARRDEEAVVMNLLKR